MKAKAIVAAPLIAYRAEVGKLSLIFCRPCVEEGQLEAVPLNTAELADRTVCAHCGVDVEPEGYGK